jgi:glucose/arabinose dehydrogenase
VPRSSRSACSLAAGIGIALIASAVSLETSQSGGVVSLYQGSCAKCHGVHLEGGPASNLKDGDWAAGGDDQSLASVISVDHWGPRRVPRQPPLSAAQIRTLIIYIREQESRIGPSPAWSAKQEPRIVVKSRLHDFVLETVAEGVEQPWSLAFLPDGRMLVTEKPGRLRVIQEGRLLPEPIEGTPAVFAKGQGGLLDVAVHPQYERTPWVFVTYSAPGPQNTSLTTVSRGHITNGRWSHQQTLFRLPDELYRQTSIHFGSRIVFDKRGFLYFSVGELGFADDAQDLTRPNGKVHRIADDGAIPDDNPVNGVVNGLRSIWSFGNRNPQGLAFDPATGDLWEVEQGPRGGDELNRIDAGRNYGWPIVSHGMKYDGTPVSASTSADGLEQPVYQWTPSITVSSMDFYVGDVFPKWRNHLFVGTLTYQELRRLVIQNSRVIEEEVVLKNHGRVRDVVTGPDGFVYVALNGPDRIARLVPSAR